MASFERNVDDMQTATRPEFVSVEDYLAAEMASDVRHEYLGGNLYAMAGETREHNEIAQNFAFSVRPHIRKGGCKLYLSDIRLNFELRGEEYFFYPDLVVGEQSKATLASPKLSLPLAAVYEGV